MTLSGHRGVALGLRDWRGGLRRYPAQVLTMVDTFMGVN